MTEVRMKRIVGTDVCNFYISVAENTEERRNAGRGVKYE
jgi:hypothetical protein